MSETILSDSIAGVQVASYCGPVTGDGSPRIRYQIWRSTFNEETGDQSGTYIQLSYQQMRALTQWVIDNWNAHNQNPRQQLPFTFTLSEVIT